MFRSKELSSVKEVATLLLCLVGLTANTSLPICHTTRMALITWEGETQQMVAGFLQRTKSRRKMPPPPTFADGSFNWDIPQRYSVNGGQDWISFYELLYWVQIDETGMMGIDKAFVGPFYKAYDDGDSNY